MTDRRRNNLLLALSLAAGCIDAIAFVHTGSFPANMTGNSVMLGLAAVHANSDHATLSLAALLGFCAGVMAAACFLPPAPERSGWNCHVSLIFLAAGFLLLLSAASIQFLDLSWQVWLIVPSAIAMGMQSAAVLRLGVAGVSTTVITGTLTTALVRLTEKWKRRESPEKAAGSAALPVLSWTAYFLGAVIGGIQSACQADWLLALPGLILLGVALLGGIRRGLNPQV